MIINPVKYFIKKYHSKNLLPNELKFMLNCWFPFIVNRIRVKSISENFHRINVELIYSFWNRNPDKTIWGGCLSSALDPFYQIMLKQIMLNRGIVTDFYSKSIHVNFIKKVQSNLTLKFRVSEEDADLVQIELQQNNKYSGWFNIKGLDSNNNICIEGKVEVYLRVR